MSSAKVLLPLFVCIVTAALLAACGGDGASPSRGSQSLTDPSDVPTTTPWATPPPVVYVEGGPVVPSNGGAEGSYTVEPGDSAYAIALRFGITVEELAAANDMTVAEIADLSVGQKLIIPQRAPEEQQPVTTITPETGEPAATTTPETAEPETTSTPVAGEEGTYTVQDGDIPVTIAEKFGITVEALLAANDDIDPTNLSIGQVLIIPTPTPEP
jgi:LysM repeat protein